MTDCLLGRRLGQGISAAETKKVEDPLGLQQEIHFGLMPSVVTLRPSLKPPFGYEW